MSTSYLKMRNRKAIVDLFFFEVFHFIKWLNYEIWLLILAKLLELLLHSSESFLFSIFGKQEIHNRRGQYLDNQLKKLLEFSIKSLFLAIRNDIERFLESFF
jgi:hypothetical protein